MEVFWIKFLFSVFKSNCLPHFVIMLFKLEFLFYFINEMQKEILGRISGIKHIFYEFLTAFCSLLKHKSLSNFKSSAGVIS